jgi:hypothetical protein
MLVESICLVIWDEIAGTKIKILRMLVSIQLISFPSLRNLVIIHTPNFLTVFFILMIFPYILPIIIFYWVFLKVYSLPQNSWDYLKHERTIFNRDFIRKKPLKLWFPACFITRITWETKTHQFKSFTSYLMSFHGMSCNAFVFFLSLHFLWSISSFLWLKILSIFRWYASLCLQSSNFTWIQLHTGHFHLDYSLISQI